MTGNEYQKLAMRTNDGKSTQRLGRALANESTYNISKDGISFEKIPGAGHIDFGAFMFACLGLSGEVGEFNDMMKKIIFHEADYNEEHAKRELGDICWYVALMCEAFGWSLEEIFQINIDKLLKRYPDGFDVEKARNRKKGDI